MDPLLMLLQRLNEQNVDYVLVGGMAAIAHGARVVTEDVDVCASMSSENIMRIVRAMEGLHAKWSRLLNIDALLACKRAASRPKDQQSIRALEAIRNQGDLFLPRARKSDGRPNPD